MPDSSEPEYVNKYRCIWQVMDKYHTIILANPVTHSLSDAIDKKTSL